MFCNLEMMRYAVYCGESIVVGYLRTWPGSAVLDAVVRGARRGRHLAVQRLERGGAAGGGGAGPFARRSAPFRSSALRCANRQLVKVLGYAIFLAAFVPLIFGGTIYKMLERVMTIKLVIVLAYLLFFAVFMVSAANAWEVCRGFFRVGTVPLRAGDDRRGTAL